MSKREYHVDLPISGRITVTVVAENKKEAVDKAIEEADIKDISECEFHRKLFDAEGRFIGLLSKAEVFEGDEVDEEWA